MSLRHSEAVLMNVPEKAADPRTEYDHQRQTCPVRQQGQEITVYGHAEALAVATQPQRYSSRVSRFTQIPNGLDGPEHARYRALIDPYLTSPPALARIGALTEQVMQELWQGLVLPTHLDAVNDLGATFAVRVQLRWLGWDAALEPELLDWIAENRAASRSGDRNWTARVALAFDTIIRRELEIRRSGHKADDVTGQLLRDQSLGRPLYDEELVSILRNWTAGDLGSLALCIGVVTHSLATMPEVQAQLRSGVADEYFDMVLDELLRLDDPFVSNRRRANADSDIGGLHVPAGQVIHLNWTAANRDPRAFSSPEAFDPLSHAAANLVYGAGPHACPGRSLSTLELRVFTRELLRRTRRVALAGTPERERPPGGGYATVPLCLE